MMYVSMYVSVPDFKGGGQQYRGWNYNNISETRLTINVATALLLDELWQLVPSVVIQWKVCFD